MNLPCGSLTEVCDVWARPSVRQRLRLALFSVGVGLIAGTGGLALMVGDSDRSGFAFAPVQTLAVETAIPNSDAEVPLAKIVREVTDLNASTGEITQRENLKPCPASSFDADIPCVLEPTSNPDVVAPKPNQPVSAATRTGHDSGATIVAEPHPTASFESTPNVEESATQSTDAPVAVETQTMEPPTTKPQKAERPQSGHRRTNQQSWAWLDSHSARRGRQHFWPFW